MDNPLQIIALFVLIIITAYFVAAEFAFVKVRSSRIEQLVSEGNKSAVKVQVILNNLDGYLSATQLGITITSLALGWIGESAVHSVLAPLFKLINLSESITHILSVVVSFLLVTFLHVVLGELTPKSIAINKAEWICLKLSSSLITFYKVLYPFIWLLNSSSGLIVKSFGLRIASEHNEEHSEEEIKLIVSSSNDINSDEKSMVEKIFDFDETITREIMVHRKDMNCIFLNDELEDIVKYVRDRTFSRFPVVGVDKDDIKGYINIRDLYALRETGDNLNKIIRSVPKVYEHTPIKKVLTKLQKNKSQMAIVIDEYGGVSGLVTMENILEEIVGDIQDEYDNEIFPIAKGKNRWIIEGDTHIEDVEKAINYIFEDKKDVVTFGGYVMSKLESEQLVGGHKLEVQGIEIELLKVEEARILSLAIPIMK